MSMCKVVSCVVGRGYLLLTSVFLWQNFVSLYPASFCMPRPNLPGISWLLAFAFQFSMINRTFFFFFFGLCYRRSCRSSWNHSTSASLALVVGAYTWITVMLNGLPWKQTEVILSSFRLHPNTSFQILLLKMRAAPIYANYLCSWEDGWIWIIYVICIFIYVCTPDFQI